MSTSAANTRKIIYYYGYVTSSYGNEQKDMGSAPYACTWDNQYYRWHVTD